MMGKEASKELFEWYAKVAHDKISKMPKVENFKECKNRKEYSEYMLNTFIAFYGLRCTCDDCMDWEFSIASSHYQKCDLWKFCHIVNRCLDWSEHQDKLKEVK